MEEYHHRELCESWLIGSDDVNVRSDWTSCTPKTTTFWDVITVLYGLKEIHPCPSKTLGNIYQFVQCHIQEGGNFNVYCIRI